MEIHCTSKMTLGCEGGLAFSVPAFVRLRDVKLTWSFLLELGRCSGRIAMTEKDVGWQWIYVYIVWFFMF